MPRQPVEVVRTQGAKAEELDIKRFYVPGYTITSKCPRCGATAENNLEREYLSYPSLSEPTEVSFGCNDDCDTSWSGLVQVSVEVRAVAPEQAGGAS